MHTNRKGAQCDDRTGKLERRKKITKIILVTVTVLFIFVMLVVPLFSVMASALKEGLGFYLKAISTS